MKNTASIIALEFAVSATKTKKKERPKKFQPVSAMVIAFCFKS
jgi:hypothetical protein